MAKLSLSFLFILFLVSIQSSVFAEDKFPIVSANGFSCSQNNDMVTCRGSFPSQATPVIEGTGYNVVWIRAEYPGQTFTYYSDSGCLCRADFQSGGEVKNQSCTSQFGHQKNFKGRQSSYDWCKKN